MSKFASDLYEENNYIQINEKYCHTFGYGNAFFV